MCAEICKQDIGPSADPDAATSSACKQAEVAVGTFGCTVEKDDCNCGTACVQCKEFSKCFFGTTEKPIGDKSNEPYPAEPESNDDVDGGSNAVDDQISNDSFAPRPSMSSGTTAGIVAGVLLAVILIAGTIFSFVKRKKNAADDPAR